MTLALSVALLLAGCAAQTQHGARHAAGEIPGPNIVFILADDMGYGDLGCYGQGRIKTPHIDQLAREGMRFLAHYAGSTVCAPSRCALMTGMHTGHASVRGNGATGNGSPLPDSALTVAEVMKRAGYATAMIGKWGLGNDDTSGRPDRQGFDFYYGVLDQILAHNFYPEFLLKNGRKENLRNEVVYKDSTHWTKGKGSYATKKVDYAHDLFIKEAISFIDENRSKPFFLYLPLTVPHNNGEAPVGERQEVPELGIYANHPYLTEASAAIQQETRAYAAMVTRMDRDVGRIMEKLRSLKIDKNTIVIFASDNGPMPYSHQFSAFFSSNAQFSGYKTDLLEGGIRVPLIVRWPGKVKAGSVSSHPSAFWDFLPTMAEIAGQKPPAGIDGISYLPTLLGQPQTPHPHLYWEYENQQAVRLGIWKGIRVHPTQISPMKLRLYNLAEDISEQVDVADQFPDVVSQMQAIMEQEHVYSPLYPFKSEVSRNRP
ncbi:arylsulfatase [Telluribacter sp.]|uniref:arylsulfatase n=1 Tax=Telluribacter sp. TaxID=1978767 RepID=UPI002E0DA0DD|nr:arylsulfatase [Telluribacter sp.]